MSSTPAGLAEALAMTAAPACACDSRGIITAANAILATLAGRPLEGAPVASLFAGAAPPELVAALASEQTWRAQIVLSERTVTVDVHTLPMPSRSGAIIVFSLFIPPASDDVAAEPFDAVDAAVDDDTVRARLLEQAAVLEHAPVGIVVTLPNQVKSCNPGMAGMLGYAAEDLIGHSPVNLFASRAHYDAFVGEAQAVLDTGSLFEKAEVQLCRRDGSLIWCRIRAKALDPAARNAGTVWIVEDVSEARRAAIEVRAIMTNASISIFFTRERNITRYNECFARTLGFDADEAIGLSTRVLYATEEEFAEIGKRAYGVLEQGRSFKVETTMVRRDGSPMWVNLMGYAVSPEELGRGTIVWMMEDRTHEKLAEESLRNALLENQAILDNAVLGIAVVDGGRTLHCNRKMEELFGYEGGTIQGLQVRALYPDTDSWLAARAVTAREFEAGRIYMAEHQLARRDGTRFWARLSGRLFDLNERGGRSVWLIDDVTEQREAADALRRARDELEVRVQERTAELQSEIVERRQAQARVQHMAYHDALTGLPNRALLSDRLDRGMRAAHRDGGKLALLFLDLDRFKTINDSLGHLTGDHVLKVVAQRLSRVVRASDTVARLGGDEFVILVPGVHVEEECGLVGDKIIEALSEPVDFEGRSLHISPSIGICLYPDDGEDVESLMRKADAAMYQAKAAGRNNYQFYAERMNQTQHFEFENRLRGALVREEFVLFFQPIVKVGDRRLHAMEVLLRWRHPERGIVAPDEFIPILEENGLIVPVGEWVIRTACEQVVAWQRAGLRPVPMAVNLSARQFMHRGLIEAIRRIIDETGIDPALLEFELTETALMQHGGLTLETLGDISHMGIHLSIDDFGTGYSSLAYLKRFPVRKIKIDRAFVRDLETSSEDQAIVAAIMALAGSLQLSVVAEGVETDGQLALLHHHGCQFAQGYLFARPLPAEQIPALLAAQP